MNIIEHKTEKLLTGLILSLSSACLLNSNFQLPAMAQQVNSAGVPEAAAVIASQATAQTALLQNQTTARAITLDGDAASFSAYEQKHAAEVVEAMRESGTFVGRHWAPAYSAADMQSVIDQANQVSATVSASAATSSQTDKALADERTSAIAESAQNLQSLMMAPKVQGEPALSTVGTNLYVRNYSS